MFLVLPFLFLYPPSPTPSYPSATPTQLDLCLLSTPKSSPSLQNRAQWIFWQCNRLVGIVARSNNQHSRQKSTTSMSCTHPSTDLPLANLLENLALTFSPASTAASKCVVFFPTAPQAAFATEQLKLQTRLCSKYVLISELW